MPFAMPREITLAESVAAVLRDAIRSGEHLCGERLVELTLAHDFHVSQNTVRDALRILEREGWVVKHARRGVYVRAFNRDEAEELYALWAALEGLALRWAVHEAARGELAHLSQIIAQMEQRAHALDWPGALEAAFEFHAALVHLARRPQTAEFLFYLHNRARLLENLRELRAPRGLHGWNTCLDAYRGLLDHIGARDAVLACRALDDLLAADGQAALSCL